MNDRLPVYEISASAGVNGRRPDHDKEDDHQELNGDDRVFNPGDLVDPVG